MDENKIEILAKETLKTIEKEVCITSTNEEETLFYDGFIIGYKRCKQDNINRKYTEEDMIKAILFGMQKGLNVGEVDETDNDWVNNYIKSLNNVNKN